MGTELLLEYHKKATESLSPLLYQFKPHIGSFGVNVPTYRHQFSTETEYIPYYMIRSDTFNIMSENLEGSTLPNPVEHIVYNHSTINRLAFAGIGFDQISSIIPGCHEGYSALPYYLRYNGSVIMMLATPTYRVREAFSLVREAVINSSLYRELGEEAHTEKGSQFLASVYMNDMIDKDSRVQELLYGEATAIINPDMIDPYYSQPITDLNRFPLINASKKIISNDTDYINSLLLVDKDVPKFSDIDGPEEYSLKAIRSFYKDLNK
ncbi:MAG TPA: hypothetical protein VK031_08085 [Tissierellaceae bacterium]|nr:hypothetical protein [Tissierellaceae bacterium]